ncbi:WXG100 family type VII secretion target [Streptomyces sp. NPDC088923]|uniref:WXG100 family type VII secretion target n=1 Tax=Streptomyces sp. NPDC088923 TaxID=3365913 RepID=UPI00380ACEA0
MADPADYDFATVSVDPQGIEEISRRLLGLADNVADAVENIADASFQLQLGWAGTSAEEAKAFGGRWDAVMTEMFGSKKNPGQGVLNVMAGVVDMVAVTFSNTEVKLEQAFHDFTAALGSGDSNVPTSAPPDAPANLDPEESAVLEDFPN